LSSENPEEKWLTFKIFLNFSSAENFVMPPVKHLLANMGLLQKLIAIMHGIDEPMHYHTPQESALLIQYIASILPNFEFR